MRGADRRADLLVRGLSERDQRYGVEGFTDEHRAGARGGDGVERVLIAYDRDEAGDAAAEKLAAKLMAEGIECFRVVFPKGMDANEYALKARRRPTKSLGRVLRASAAGSARARRQRRRRDARRAIVGADAERVAAPVTEPRDGDVSRDRERFPERARRAC